MAEISKSGTPSLTTLTPCSSSRVGSGLLAGEALAAGDFVYIKSDGLVWRASGAAANAAAKARGIVVVASASGEACTVYRAIDVRYGAGLTPGADYYLSGTVAGGIADAASTGGTAPIAYAIDATRIHVML